MQTQYDPQRRNNRRRATHSFSAVWAKAALLFGFIAIAGLTNSQEVHVVPQTSSLLTKTPDLEPASSPGHFFRIKVDLVLVPVTVTDHVGRSVTGLDAENFQIYEDKERQIVKHLSTEDAPLSLGIIFDTSGSMAGKIVRAREAIGEFMNTANLEDEFFMISFSDRPKEVSDFTSSPEDILSRLALSVPKGRTALLDAIYLGLTRMRQAQYARKALLIISDGGDNNSRYTERDIRSMVRESDTMIYGIGIFDRSFPTSEELAGPALLTEISEETGGRTFTIDNPNDLGAVAAQIGVELRNQYVLSYRPAIQRIDGKWHKIKVKLLLPKGLPPLTVHARKGYYAHSE